MTTGKSVFIINLFILGILTLIIGPSLVDHDNALGTSNLSIYNFFLKSISLPATLLVLFNLVIFSYVLAKVYVKDRFFYLLLIVNPFCILNVVDAYNRFAFTIMMLVCFSHLIKKNLNFTIPLSMVALFVHPFNFASLYINAMKSKKYFIFIAFLSVSFILIAPFAHVFFLENSKKYAMFIKYGGDVSSLYGGNMLVASDYMGFDFYGILSRTIAFLFPFPYLVKQDIYLLLFSIFNLFLYICLFFKLDRIELFVFFISYLVIVSMVGNFAVAQRHILPLVCFFAYCSEKRALRFKI